MWQHQPFFFVHRDQARDPIFEISDVSSRVDSSCV
jgi:hypothetical protein